MLRNFMAVMKDSFREAVDGFIIYVMLGLVALTVLFALSFSFEPNSGDKGFESIVQRFPQVFRNRGADTEEVANRVKIERVISRENLPLKYSATDVQKLDASKGHTGTYKLLLTAQMDDGTGGQRGPGAPRRPTQGQEVKVVFPSVVYAWSQPKFSEQYVLLHMKERGEGGAQPTMPEIEIVPEGKDPEEALEAKQRAGGRWLLASTPKVSPQDAASVTDEMMQDFIKNQFLIHGDIADVKVTRRTSADKSEYTFDVEAEVKDGAKGWPYDVKFIFGSLDWATSSPVGNTLFDVQDKLINVVGASVTLLIAVILTGFFIPNMLRKGSLDLVIAKPMARWELLLYKYIGGLIFMLMISGLSVGGVWIVMALRSGNWNPTFLLTIPLITFTFAVLYAVSTLVAVLTRSAIAAIIVTALFMVLLGVVGGLKTFNDIFRPAMAYKEDKEHPYFVTVDVLNALLPRYNDLLKINSRAMSESYQPASFVRVTQRNETPSWVVAGGISLGYIAFFLSLAYLRFATRDP